MTRWMFVIAAACTGTSSSHPAIDAAGVDHAMPPPAACETIAFPAPAESPCVGVTRTVLGRSVCVHLPATAPGPLPVVVMLHAYGETQATQATYFALDDQVDARGFVLVKPDGTLDRLGHRSWNAFPICCSLASDPSPPDDVAFLDAVLADIATVHAIDATRIYFVGHSNGAFMSHRYACDRAGVVAAFVSLEGGVQVDQCHPTGPVSMVEIHGTADANVPYDGGGVTPTDPGGTWPSVADTMGVWTAAGGCSATSTDAGMLDLMWTATSPSCGQPDGDDTAVHRFACPAAGVEHWEVPNGIHGPALSAPQFATAVLDFFAAHPRPSGSANDRHGMVAPSP